MYKTNDEEDYNKVIDFLTLEKQMDEANVRELLLIEPSHLTKAKITELGKLSGRYKKESDKTIKEYKENWKNRVEKHKPNELEKKRTWYIA